MTDRRLSPEELESLLGAVPDAAGGTAGNATAPPVRAVAGLRRLHGALAGTMAAGLSSAVRAQVDVRLVDVESLPFRHWHASAGTAACVGAFRTTNGETAWMLRLDGEVLRSLLDGMLGGAGHGDSHSSTPLTDWELRLSERAVEPIRQHWLDAWFGWFPLQVTPFQPLTGAVEQSGWPPTQRLFVARYLVSWGLTRGPLELATPVDLAVRWMSPQWSRADTAERKSGSAKPSPASTPMSTLATVTDGTSSGELRVMLADTVISRADLESLQPGDVLATDHRIDRPLDAHLPDGTHIPAQLGIVDGQKAIRS